MEAEWNAPVQKGIGFPLDSDCKFGDHSAKERRVIKTSTHRPTIYFWEVQKHELKDNSSLSLMLGCSVTLLHIERFKHPW